MALSNARRWQPYRRRNILEAGATTWAFWGGSLSDTMGDYTFTLTRADVATHVGTDGYLKEVAANVARFESNPGGSAALGLLHEDLQTNLYTYGSNVATTGWTYSNGASDGGTDATVTGMDGNDARKINVGQSNSVIIQTVTTVSTTKYCCSYYVRYGLLASFKRITLWNTTDAINVAFAWDGDSWDFSASSGSPDSYGAEEHVDGWWRVWIVTTAGGTSTQFRLQFEGGSSGEYMHVGCVQCEAVPYADSTPTSWIPTTSSSEPRARDLFQIDPFAGYPVDAATGITMLMRYKYENSTTVAPAADEYLFRLYKNSGAIEYNFRYSTAGSPQMRSHIPHAPSGNHQELLSSIGDESIGAMVTLAVGANPTDKMRWYLDGTQVATEPDDPRDDTFDRIAIGGSFTSGPCYRVIVREFRIYDGVVHSDSELAELTT